MSLRRVKLIYCLMMISVAVVLACTAGIIGWITAVLLLSGALPVFRAVTGAAEMNGARSALKGFRDHLAPQATASHNQSIHSGESDR